MFQSHALRGLLLFAITASIVKAEVFVDDDIQAVVIQAPIEEERDDGSNRNGKQLLLSYPLPIVRVEPSYPGTIVELPCMTVENATGRCTTINKCHPTWKVFRTEAQDSWAFGLHNTCSYNTGLGKQVFGVCCPNNENEGASFGDETLLENNDGRSISAKKKQQKGTAKATACLLTNTQKQKIQSSRCSRSNVRMQESVHVSDQFIVNETTTPFVTFDPHYPWVAQRFVWRYKRAIDLNNVGGVINNRIINGKPVDPHQFKFVAALLTEDYQGRVRQFCGGSVIDEYHILTAAHCVASYTEDDVRRLRVQLGVHDIKNTPSKSTHRVDRIIRHIDFSQRTLDNDVAILTLNTPAPINSNYNVKPVCLADGSGLLESRNAIVAGWGSLKFGSSKFPKELYSVNVKVWNNDKCNNNYGAQAPGGITRRMLCASLPGKDSCQGDSGGALFTCSSSSDCTQIGIVSWGIGCAQAKYPGVYTRVTEMNDWIKRITSCY